MFRKAKKDAAQAVKTLEYHLHVVTPFPTLERGAVECLGGWSGIVRHEGKIIWQGKAVATEVDALDQATHHLEHAFGTMLKIPAARRS